MKAVSLLGCYVPRFSHRSLFGNYDRQYAVPILRGGFFDIDAFRNRYRLIKGLCLYLNFAFGDVERYVVFFFTGQLKIDLYGFIVLKDVG